MTTSIKPSPSDPSDPSHDNAAASRKQAASSQSAPAAASSAAATIEKPNASDAARAAGRPVTTGAKNGTGRAVPANDARSPGCNVAVALGSISSPVDLRTLPSGTKIASFSISVTHGSGPATSVPASWPTPAPKLLARLEPGTDVLAIGRVVRRFYRAGGATQSRTELVVERIEPLSRRVACRRMVEQVIGHLEATVAERLM